MAARKRNGDSEFESEWTFIDTEDEGTIETRKDSVVYRKPTYSEIVAGTLIANEGNESEPEFEILAGFQFRPDLQMTGPGSTTAAEVISLLEDKTEKNDDRDIPDAESYNSDNTGENDDGIMIISNHFNLDDPDTNDDYHDTVDNSLSSSTGGLLAESFNSVSGWKELTSLTDSDITHTQDLDGWKELPSLIESGTFSMGYQRFGTDDDIRCMQDLDGWKELTSITESGISSVSASSFDGDIINSCPDTDGDTNNSFIAVNLLCTAYEESSGRFWSPEFLDEHKEFVTITSSGTFSFNEETPSSDEDSSVEFVEDAEESSGESFVAVDQPEESYQESSDGVDGWKELPLLTTSGSFSFSSSSDIQGSDPDIECIQDIDENDYTDDSFVAVDVREEQCDDALDMHSITSSLVSSACSSCTENDNHIEGKEDDDETDPMIYFPGWLDEEHEEHQVDELLEEQHRDPVSHLYVDIPTFVILLCLTTALGFSIGHGVSIYLGNQAISRTGKLERFGTVTDTSQGSRKQSELTAEQEARIDLWRLEERLYQQEEDLHSEKDLFDLRSVHTKLQEKHYNLMNSHKNTRQRLQISKMMSWFWRLKFDEEIRRQENSSSGAGIHRKQLDEMRNMYAKEKKTADIPRHLGTNPHVVTFRDIYGYGKRLSDQDILERHLLKKNPSNSVKNRKVTRRIGHSSLFEESHTPRTEVSVLTPPRSLQWTDFRERWTQNSKVKQQLSLFCIANKLTSTVGLQPKFHNGAVLDGKIQRNPSTKKKVNSQEKHIKATKTLSTQAMYGLSALSDPLMLKKKSPENSNTRSTKTRLERLKMKRAVYKNVVEKQSRRVNKVDTIAADKNGKNGMALKVEQNAKNKFNVRVDDTPARSLLVKPCVSKPTKKREAKSDKPVSPRKDTQLEKLKEKSLVYVKQGGKPSKGETARRFQRHKEDIWEERVKRRERKRQERELKERANELKLVLAELRRERRRAQKEKCQLEKSWRALKRQKAQFQDERLREQKKMKKEMKDVLKHLREEKTRMKKWKKEEEILLHVSLSNLRQEIEKERAHLVKRRFKEIQSIKKELKLEKRKLREQQRDLKQLKKDLRKERHVFAKNENEKKKRARKSEQKGKSLYNRKKSRIKKKGKNKGREVSHQKVWPEQSNRKPVRFTGTLSDYVGPPRQEQIKTSLPTRGGRRIRKHQWKKEQGKFWSDLEKNLEDWARNVSRTRPGLMRKKSRKSFKKQALNAVKRWQEQYRRLVLKEWETMKRNHRNLHRDRKPRTKYMKTKPSGPLEDGIYEKILAEQLEYDKRKRQRAKSHVNEWVDSWSRLQKQEKRSDFRNRRKKKKQKWEESPKMLMRERRRKQRRKYQRELERLHQWALQMDEKKLEHERLYGEKGKRNPKCPRERSKTRQQNQLEINRAVRSHGGKKSKKRTDLIQMKNITVLTLELKPQPTTEKRKAKITEISRSFTKTAVSAFEETRIAQLVRESRKGTEKLPQKNGEESVRLSDAGGTILISKRKLNSAQKGKHRHDSLYGEESGIPLHEQKLKRKPTPPDPKPALYHEFPLLQFLEERESKRGYMKSGPMGNPSREETSSNALGPVPPPEWRERKHDDHFEAWYVRRAVDRDILRKGNPLVTWFPRPGPLKSDGSWFFHRADDRTEQRVHTPWYARTDGEGSYFRNSWKFQANFPRKRKRKRRKDGTWFFNRADDRADQRYNSEPWYMRRAAGREEDRGYYGDGLRHASHEDNGYSNWFPWARNEEPCFGECY